MSLTDEYLETIKPFILDGYTSEIKKIVSKLKAQTGFTKQASDYVGLAPQLPRLKTPGSFSVISRLQDGEVLFASTNDFLIDRITRDIATQVAASCNSICLSCEGLRAEVDISRRNEYLGTEIRISSHCSMRNSPCPDEAASFWKTTGYLKGGENSINDERISDEHLFEDLMRGRHTSPFGNSPSPETLMEISMKKAQEEEREKEERKNEELRQLEEDLNSLQDDFGSW